MNAKEYLGQAYRIDQRINSKIEQVSSLRELATKATATITDMPGAATPNVHRMADVVCKIVALEEEINAEIDRLVDLKAEIIGVIRRVENPEYQTLLELRYLCFYSWEEIAVAMSYNVRTIYRLHDLAVKCVAVPENTN